MKRIIPLVTLLSLTVISSAQAASSVRINGLTPAYSSSQTDFTTSCSKPITVSVVPSGANLVSVDGRRFRKGPYKVRITLKAGQRFVVAAKQRGKKNVQSIRCLPADFPIWKTKGKGSSQLGWMILAPNLFLDLSPSVMRPVETSRYVVVANSSGTPVWWQKDKVAAPWDATLLPSGKLAWSRYNYDRLSGDLSSYRVYGWNGRQHQPIASPAEYPDSHEIVASKDGGYLMLSSEPRNCPAVPSECADLSAWGGPAAATIMDSVISRIDSKGKAIWRWSTKDHLEVADGERWFKLPSVQHKLSDGRNVWDIFHINSLQEDSRGIVFSARQADAIYRINSSSGKIIWKLGGAERSYSLAVSGIPLGAKLLAGPHDAQLLPDGSVSVYDNGTALRSPRAIRFGISGNQATVLETISDPLVTFSACCGSARRLPGGDWLISNGGSSTIKELTPSGRPLMTLTMPSGSFSYRAKVVGAQLIKASELRSGMDFKHPRK